MGLRFRIRGLGAAIVAIAGITMLTWTWGTWPDPVVDFGREIYVPWRLSEGDVLYRDIVSYFNGPLSPYLHSMLFRMCGTGLRTLVIFNIAVTGAIAAMLMRLIARAAGELAGTACGVAFLVLFAFAQYLVTGTYNYVCPYSYELTHGIALTLAMILCLQAAMNRHSAAWFAAAGAAFGLVWLTKAEIAFAASLAVIAAFAAARISPRQLAVFAACAIAPIAVALLLLCLAMPISQALGGILGSWRWIGDRALLDLPYFKEIAGTDDPVRSIRSMLRGALVYLAIFAPAAGIALLQRNRRATRLPIAAATFVIMLVVGMALWQAINWSLFVAPLPILLVGVLTFVVFRLLRARAREADLCLPLVLLVWSLAMLAKIPLNVRIYHYGFALAMPGTMVAIAILLGCVPRLIDRAGGNGLLFRAAVLAALAVSLYAHVRWMGLFFDAKTETVSAGADRFRADRRAIVTNQALEQIARTTAPGRTLVALPEGLIINYLSRSVNPSGQLNFTPPAIIMYGEEAMLRAFERRPPDLVALLSIDSSEYGARYFGRDYAHRLGAWIGENYRPAKPFVVQLDRRTHFAIELLERRNARATEREAPAREGETPAGP
jgi:hypothetical protein